MSQQAEIAATVVVFSVLACMAWAFVTIARQRDRDAKHYRALEAEIIAKRANIQVAIEANQPQVKQPGEAA